MDSFRSLAPSEAENQAPLPMAYMNLQPYYESRSDLNQESAVKNTLQTKIPVEVR
jgi:hypothetical protein